MGRRTLAPRYLTRQANSGGIHIHCPQFDSAHHDVPLEKPIMAVGIHATMPVYSRPRLLSGLVRLVGRRARRLPIQANVPPRALSIWQERPDLRAVFDLNLEAGREGLTWWYLRHGFSEFGLNLNDSDIACLANVNLPLSRITQLSFLPITWLMNGLSDRSPLKGAKRKDLRASREKQEHLLSWFFAYGLTRANLAAFLTPEQARALLANDTEHPQLPRLLACIWSSQPQLHNRFAGPDDPAFRDWCSGEGGREFPILYHPMIGLAPRPARRSHKLKPFGVNLFGHAHGRSGVSEDVRMAARALSEAGIPFAIHNVPPGPGMLDEEDLNTAINQELAYAINMFSMTAQATALAVTKIGTNKLLDYYNIGFWPWELPELPDFWKHAYDLVDEVWASSRFTYDAFHRSSPKPVRHMPFAVAADESSGMSRADFGLPDEKFLFGFAFDGLSGFSRKAPLAAIRAFKLAFPPEDASVGLVIKGLRTSDAPQWRQIVDEAGDDDRIHFITESLPRGELLDLWRALDCFVSLHRSEGFGRNIAETMLLAKPVVVSAHSGNMDFTRHDTAALVPCTLHPVQAGEYPFSTGQLWAEPDITAAATQMRKIVSDRAWRCRMSQSGSALIADLYAPQVVGRSWEPVLRGIYASD